MKGTVYIVVKNVPDHAIQICSVHDDYDGAAAEAVRRNRKGVSHHEVEGWAVLSG